MRRGVRKAAPGWLVAATLYSTTVFAASTEPAGPSRSSKIEYAIDSKPLGEALNDWGVRSKLPVLINFEGPQVQAPALHGRYTPEAALRILLRGTGWTYCYVRSDAVAITTDPRKVWNSEGCTKLSEEYARETLQAASAEGADPGRQRIEEVTVRSTRTLNADIERTADDAQPYVIITRKKIESSGAATLEDLLRRQLPMAAPSMRQQLGWRDSFSRIELGALPWNQTLILVDGRRLGSWSINGLWQQPDLHVIPPSQIEKIDVLPVGAAGIYGGDATGGAINIIRRRDYTGLETMFRYGSNFKGDGTDRSIGVSGGTSWNDNGTTLQFSGQIDDVDPSIGGKRRSLFSRTQSARAQSGDTPVLGYTTNIASATGSNLTLKTGTPLNSPITSVPVGYAGPSTDQGTVFIANAGTYNLDLPDTAQLGGAKAPLLDGPTTGAANLFLKQRVSEALSLFADNSYSYNRSEVQTNRMNVTLTVPRDTPTNPFDQDVRITTPAIGADQPRDVELQSWRAVVGGTYKINNRLQLGFDHAIGRIIYKAKLPGDINETGLDAIRSGSIDVFKDTNVHSVDLASFREPPSVFSRSTARLSDTNLRAFGTLSLPVAGEVDFNANLEHRKETSGQQFFADAQSTLLTPERHQTVTSVFVQGTKKLVSLESNLSEVRLLELSFAARFDRYDTHGADLSTGTLITADNHVKEINPTLGLRFDPFREVEFRASYGTGFLPPAASQLIATPIVYFPGYVLGLKDPMRGDEAVGMIGIQSGGNASLRAEKSATWSAGIIINPYYFHDFRLSLDWAHTDKKEEINHVPLSQDALLNETRLPQGTIIRAERSPDDPYGVGVITGFFAGQTNLGRRKNDALNIQLDFGSIALAGGKLGFSAIGVKQLRSRIQLDPSGPWVENAGLVQAPEWRANATLEWNWRDWSVSWSTRFIDRYWLHADHSVNTLQGSATVPSQNYSDTAIQWSDAAHPRWGSGMQVQFGVTNVFGQTPPADFTALVTGTARYSPLGEPQGAAWYVSLRNKF